MMSQHFDFVPREDSAASGGGGFTPGISVVGVPHDSTRSVLSPRIGSPEGHEEGCAIDLADVEYLAPSGDYWVRECAWLRGPRVRQFCRPKFLGVVMALVLTPLFLAATITLITIPGSSSTTSSVVESTTTDPACTQIHWPVGGLLLRDPFDITRLIALNPTNATLDLTFDITRWDYVAQFNGSYVEFFGPDIPLPNDNTTVAFNSWGVLPNISSVSSPKDWWGNQLIEVFPVASTSTSTVVADGSTGASNSPSSTDASSIFRRRLLSATSLTVSAEDISYTRFYLYNNRSDVHLSAYTELLSLSSTSRQSTLATSRTKSTAIPRPHTRSLASSDQTLPLYLLRLYVSGTSLSFCGSRFVSSADGDTSLLDGLASSSTGA